MSAQLELLPTQAQLRDQALDTLAEARALLVAAARSSAMMIAMRDGRVTSPEVLAALREGGYAHQLDRVDPRFMGVVFRNKKDAPRRWHRLGWENTGSHCRPVAIWGLA